MKRIVLDGSDWLLKEFIGLDWVWRNAADPDTQDKRWWIPATVPGSVLYDLWQVGKVPDPYYELNSKLVEWVPERTWVYRKAFKAFCLPGERGFLRLEGIDYSAEIILNGQSLGRHEGMFTPFEAEVTHLLRETENLLSVVLDPAPPEQPQVGRTSLVRTHKSRMTYWWDFCPRMIHVGLWDSVYIDITGRGRLEDVFVSSRLSNQLRVADVTVEIEADAPDGWTAQVYFGNKVAVAPIQGKRGKAEISVDRPELWWLAGYGAQYLYSVTVKLMDPEGRISDVRKLRHGIRELAWESNPGASPEMPPYTLTVNGKRVYIAGVNWVPMDVMYGVERPEKLSHLLELAVNAGVIMLRVWGGGLIEKDSFYEACADKGILVWQEFIQSSSGIENCTPDDAGQIAFMIKEACQIIRRKRNHTALSLWCGGNELQTETGDGMPLDNSDPLLGAMGGLVKLLDPQRRWLPTSPSGGLFMNSIENIEKSPTRLGDVHGPWEHQGLDKHCVLYNAGTSLMSSEFGVEGLTHLDTLTKTVAEKHLWPANKDNEIYFHRGAWWNNEPLVQEIFGGVNCIESLIKASQYLQFEGLRYALESNRRREPLHSGSFPWQFNEPYPNCFCTSLLDYYARPKPAYYAMQSAYRSLYPAASFSSQDISREQKLVCDLWICGSRIGDGGYGLLRWEVLGPEGRLADGQVTALGFGKPVHRIAVAVKGQDIVLLRLVLEVGDKRIINEYCFTATGNFGGLLNAPQTRLSGRWEEGGVWLRNCGSTTAYFVFLRDRNWHPSQQLYFHDNYVCILPGEERFLGLSGKTEVLSGRLYAEGFNCAAPICE